jgi:hypothetical protein
MQRDDTKALGGSLERAKADLKHALSEACGADISRADTGELIRVEEVLAIANEAAKDVVSVRRRLSAERRAAAESQVNAPSGCREVEDTHGVRWAILEVHPTTSPLRPSVRERFRDGWLAFDSGVETRRAAPIPADWQRLSDHRLLELLESAEVARRRAGGPTTPTTDSSPSAPGGPG